MMKKLILTTTAMATVTMILSFSIGYSIGSSFDCNVKESAIIANRQLLIQQ